MKIILNGTKSENVHVTVDLLDTVKVIVDSLLQLYGMSSDQWIDDNNQLCESIDYPHGSPGTDVVKPTTTPAQRKAYKLSKDLLMMVRDGMGSK